MKNKSRKEHIIEQSEEMKKYFPHLKDAIDTLASQMIRDCNGVGSQKGCPCGSIFCDPTVERDGDYVRCEDLPKPFNDYLNGAPKNDI